jgi:hypothetical protein
VATDRSPEGVPVALTVIQAAADRVFDGEIVRIAPASVGQGAEFVGAVLRSLPEVEVFRDPPRASLAAGAGGLSEVDAFLRTVGKPLEDPMSGCRFQVLATRLGSATYRGPSRARGGEVSTETLQAILGEVRNRADAIVTDPSAWQSFELGVETQFWRHHGAFANAVIAGIDYGLFEWPFNGLIPDEAASLGGSLPSEPASAMRVPVLEARAADTPFELVGVPYAASDESVSVAEADPVEMDPDVIGRGKRGHARLQNQLASEVAAAGLVPLSPSDDDPPFDLAWRDGTDVFVVEVKSTTRKNEEHQLRLGLGQLLRYRHVLAADGTTVCGILYVERKPTDPGWFDLCQSLDITLRWPTP